MTMTITPIAQKVERKIPLEKIGKRLGYAERINVTDTIREALKIKSNNELYFSPTTPIPTPSVAKKAEVGEIFNQLF